MVTAFDRVDLGGRTKTLDVWFDFVRGAEGVASALHKEHRRFDVFEMFDAKLRGLPGWMERVTEKHEARNVIDDRFPRVARHHLRRNPAAHRLTPEDESIALQLLVFERGCDYCQEASFELVLLIGN